MTTNTSALSEITRLWWNREGVGESRGSIRSTGSIPISITKTLLSPSKFPELFKLSAKEPRTKARQIMYTTMVYWPQGTKQCIHNMLPGITWHIFLCEIWPWCYIGLYQSYQSYRLQPDLDLLFIVAPMEYWCYTINNNSGNVCFKKYSVPRFS